jgi:hypothetical protein
MCDYLSLLILQFVLTVLAWMREVDPRKGSQRFVVRCSCLLLLGGILVILLYIWLG